MPTVVWTVCLLTVLVLLLTRLVQAACSLLLWLCRLTIAWQLWMQVSGLPEKLGKLKPAATKLWTVLLRVWFSLK